MSLKIVPTVIQIRFQICTKHIFDQSWKYNQRLRRNVPYAWIRRFFEWRRFLRWRLSFHPESVINQSSYLCDINGVHAILYFEIPNYPFSYSEVLSISPPFENILFIEMLCSKRSPEKFWKDGDANNKFRILKYIYTDVNVLNPFWYIWKWLSKFTKITFCWSSNRWRRILLQMYDKF